MSVSPLVADDVQLSLLASTGHAGLAAEILSQKFDIPKELAEAMVEQGYGVVMPCVSLSQARRAMPLFSALGLRLVVHPLESEVPDEFCDVSIRLREAKQAKKLIRALEKHFGLTDLTAESFQGPCGLVISDLPLKRANRLATALQQVPAACVVISDHQTALYDLFSARDLTETEYADVVRHLRLMGCGCAVPGEAIGTNLERLILDRVLEKFADLDLYGINQAFERFEVLIIGKGSMSLQDFADFLSTRPATIAIPQRDLLRSLPLRVETCLKRAAARQFVSDYSAFGMHVITRLLR